MGMYTEFIFGCELSKDTPKVCIDALDYSINGEEKKPKYENPEGYEQKRYNDNYIERTTPTEEILAFIEEYDFIRLFHSCSYYFGALNPMSCFEYDYISDSYHISTRADLKNGGSIEKFIEYITPYVKHGSGWDHGIFAYVQYEEDPFPTMYGIGGKVFKNPTFSSYNVVEEHEKMINRLHNVLSKIYVAIDPNWNIQEEEYTKRGLSVEKDGGKIDLTTRWEWFADHIEERFKDIKPPVYEDEDTKEE